MKMKRHSIFAVLMLGLLTTSACATHRHDFDVFRNVHTGAKPAATQTAHRPYQHPQGGVSARHEGRNGRR